MERTWDKGVSRVTPRYVQHDQSTVGVTAMINASQIKEQMEVKGSDGKHVGTVLGVENGHLKLASGGMDHAIDIALVDAIRTSCGCAKQPRRRCALGTSGL